MSLRWKIAQWFELRWWKNYLGDKGKNEYLTWKKSYWKEILLKVSEVAEVDSSKTIGDFGCGPSGIFIEMSENKITAVDPLIEEYEKLIPFFKRTDYPNVRFVKSTIENFRTSVATQTCQVSKTWQVSPLKYDLVFCMNAINHAENMEQGFDILKEVCSDSGALILTVDAHNISLFKYLFRLVPWDILHPHQYDLMEYHRFVKMNGWRILKVELLKTGHLFNHYLMVAQKNLY